MLSAKEIARLQGAEKEQVPQAAATGISPFEKTHHGSSPLLPECQEALDCASMWIFGIYLNKTPSKLF